MRLEAQQLAMGTHAHTVILQSLFFIYGLSLIGLCKRTAALCDDEMPDLEPILARLPRDMREAIKRAIKAEQDGRIVHEEPCDRHLNLLESRYIWAHESPFWPN